MFKLATLNVRGLNPDKLNLISDFFVRERLDFVCLQETMVSDEDYQSDLSKNGMALAFGPRRSAGEVELLFLVHLAHGLISRYGRKMMGGVWSVF